MSPRTLALLLAGLAAVTLGGWAWPARTRTEAVRREVELARQRVERGARRAAARLPAAADSPATASEAVRRTRRQVLALLAGRPLSDAKLEVRIGRPPAHSELRITAEGEFAVLARLAGDLATAPGLVLARLELTPRGEASRLELELRSR